MTELYGKTLDLIVNHPVEIARGFGWKKLYREEESPMHNDWLKMLIFPEKDLLLMANRESYKTTCVISAIAIRMILMPQYTIAFFRKTDDDIKEVINGVRKCLGSEMAMGICHNLWGVELELTQESTIQITTNLFKQARGSAQLTGMGIGGSLVGKHFDIIYTDDIVTNKDRASRAEREATKKAYGELGNVLNDKPVGAKYCGVLVSTGTPWHKNDAHTKMPEPLKYNIDVTGLPSREKIERQKRILSKSEFTANYYLEHVSDEGKVFTDPKFTKDKSRVMYGSMQIDCAFGGDNYTALTIMNKEDATETYYAFGIVWDRHVKECYGDILKLYKEFKVDMCYIEDNADKGYVEQELDSMGMYCKGYHENQNKHVKIQTHLYSLWQDIYWLDTTDPDYLIQIMDYEQDAEPDDAPDSCASLLREVSNMSEAFII
jgi:hypothetical protein